jgi:DNA-directed RNA polymerase sigma subunit (sigma70/sigma32)
VQSLHVRAGIMFSLSYLATKETFREVGDRFGVSRDHTYRILNKFTRQLSGHTDNKTFTKIIINEFVNEYKMKRNAIKNER